MPVYEDGEREEGVMTSCLSENAVSVDSLSKVYLLNTSKCQPMERTKQGFLHLPREFRPLAVKSSSGTSTTTSSENSDDSMVQVEITGVYIGWRLWTS